MHEERGRIDLPGPPEHWRGQLLNAGLVELPVDGAVGLRAVQLSGLHEDPADRLIVATALVYRATLITADERFLGWKHSLVRSDARNRILTTRSYPEGFRESMQRVSRISICP